MQKKSKYYEIKNLDDNQIVSCHFYNVAGHRAEEWLIDMENILSKWDMALPSLLLTFDFPEGEIRPDMVFRAGTIIQHCIMLNTQIAFVLPDKTAFTLIEPIIHEITQSMAFRLDTDALAWLQSNN